MVPRWSWVIERRHQLRTRREPSFCDRIHTPTRLHELSCKLHLLVFLGTPIEDIDGVLHYLVEWSATLVPEHLPGHLLGHAKELVDEFEARLRAQRGVKNGRGGPDMKRREQADVADIQQQKRPRGRPRRQQ